MAASTGKTRIKRKPGLLEQWLVYIAIRSLAVFLLILDVEKNLDFACRLGRVLWRRYHRGRERALANLRSSFPEKGEDWIDNVGRRSFEHLVMLVMDVIYMPRLVRKSNWRRYSRYRGVERAKWIMKEGRGMIMVTGHYANFEIMGYLLGLFGFDVWSIARPLDNRFLNRYLYEVRRQAGQNIIDKKGASGPVEKLIGRGSTVCFIADQDAGKKGLFVDFFGRKASTYKSIGLLAMTSEVPVVVGYSRRVGNRFFFEIGVNRIIFPHEWHGKENPLEWLTAEYTRCIEAFVREDPSQYWWLHRRWKHRPRQEAAVHIDNHG